MGKKYTLILGIFFFAVLILISWTNLIGKSFSSLFYDNDSKGSSLINPQNAEEYYRAMRLSPAGIYDEEWLKHSRELVLAKIQSQNRIANMVWEERGPNNFGGRTRAICVDRNNDNHVFCGSVVGGLFESWNGGITWAVVPGFNEYLKISTMCQAMDGTYYVGTGSGFESLGNGDGIYSSSDNGATWSQVSGSAAFTLVNELSADGVTADKVWIAGNNSSGGFQSYTPSGGFVPANGTTGTLWLDCKVSPDGQVIVACKGGLYAVVSTDAGVTFNVITGATSSNQISTSGTRMEFGMSFEKNSDNKWTVYASTSTNDLRGVFISESNGEPNTWYEIAQSNTVQTSFTPFSSSAGGYGQGTYNHILSGVPGNPDHCLLGGVEMYKWKKTSSNPITGQWTQQTSWDINSISPAYAHTEEHELKWDQSGNLYMGSDGGVTKSFDKGEQSWVAHNTGLNIATFYSVAFNKYDHIMGGTANIGNLVNDYVSTNGLEFTRMLPGSEGFDCDFSHIAPNVIFYSRAFSDFYRTENMNGLNTVYDVLTPNTSGLFWSSLRLYENANDLNSQDSISFTANQNYLIGDTIYAVSQNQNQEIIHVLSAPLLQGETITIQDPVQSILAVGSASWVSVTRDGLRFNVTPTWKNITTPSGNTTCLEFSSDGNYLYVGKSNGNLVVIKNLNSFYSPANNISNVTVTLISGLGWIKGIGVDPNDPDHIVVAAGNTLMECISATTTTSSSAFTNIAASLPAMPIYDAIIDYQNSNKLVMGTEFGIYATDDGGVNWTFQQGPGMVSAQSVRQQWRTDSWNGGMVYVGTYGRGIWSSRSFVGIHEQDNTEVAVNSFFTEINTYPNPMNANGTISFEMKERGNVDIFIMDLNGKVVLAKNLGQLNQGKNTTSIDVRNLAAGNYIVTVASGNEIGTDKLIVTH